MTEPCMGGKRKQNMDTNYSHNLQTAFNEIFPEARPYKASYVSLYEVQSCYGGPEEGGWWYDWCTPIASQEVANEDIAHELAEEVRTKAHEMSLSAKADWARSMRDSCDWAEARGIDPADMDEPDGPTRFLVFVENSPGEYRTTQRPHYC